MSVTKLTPYHFRNLAANTLEFHPDVNFVLGDNGSGKSSLLEAVFFLGHGKSFRTTKLDSLCHHEQSEFVLSAFSCDNQFGLKKNFTSGQTELKLNGERLSRLSELAVNIAVQIITPESFKLFFGGPKERRRFVDLGMFHVKHQFSHLWRDFSKVLKQRNACLRSIAQHNMLEYWTEQFCHLSELIAEQRQHYIDDLTAEVGKWLAILLPDLNQDIKIQYLQGWNQKKALTDILSANQQKEIELGHTTSGAHKYDIRFVIGRAALEHTLSRGQQKLFLLALTFAQAKLIEKVKRVKPILLIDDIGAELDIHSRTALAKAIDAIDCQVIITAIEEIVLEPLVPQNKNYKMFHVKHGEIVEIDK